MWSNDIIHLVISDVDIMSGKKVALQKFSIWLSVYVVRICSFDPVAKCLLIAHTVDIIVVNYGLITWYNGWVCLAKYSNFYQVVIVEKIEESVVSIISCEKILIKHKVLDLGESLPCLPWEWHLVHLIPNRQTSHVYHRNFLICSIALISEYRFFLT